MKSAPLPPSLLRRPASAPYFHPLRLPLFGEGNHGGTKLCTINFDDANIDGDNPETITHIIHNHYSYYLSWHNKFKQQKMFKVMFPQ